MKKGKDVSINDLGLWAEEELRKVCTNKDMGGASLVRAFSKPLTAMIGGKITDTTKRFLYSVTIMGIALLYENSEGLDNCDKNMDGLEIIIFISRPPKPDQYHVEILAWTQTTGWQQGDDILEKLEITII